ncbi:MAG: hypothetical protein CVU39_25435, partial [Chloroflexi bacterium HGW-Chloroflexi-10]
AALRGLRWAEVSSFATLGVLRHITSFSALRKDFGLMDYNARFYSPYIMMFTSPDTVIPDTYNPLDWNRYAYARYNPVKYSDPTGHAVSDGGSAGCGFICDPIPSTPTTTDTPTPITDFILNQVPGSSRDWAKAGTVTDGVVLLVDLFADGIVVYATVVGFGSALPVVVIS